MDTEGLSLTPDNMRGYLTARGLVADTDEVAVRELGGGVSNIVLLIEGPEQRWVAKQSLEKLRVKDDWRSDRERIFREAESIAALGPVLGNGALPEVIHVDRENYLFIMTAAPAGSVVWKELLLDGRVDLGVARQAGLYLARLGRALAGNPRLQERFEDRTVFDQLRLDPYYRTTAARHADACGALEELIADSWKIRISLVHGDYSPKNMLVREGKIFLIDFEVVHWGDPAFDAGFLLNHLFLKAFHQPQFGRFYFDAAREFWRAVQTGLRQESTGGFAAMTMRHLGGLMLARIDGKSPVEYIRDEATKDRVRRAAKRILWERPEGLEEVLRTVAIDY